MKQPERYVEPRLTQYLFDRASRTLTPLSGTFELSPVCNLACKMCYVRKTPAEVAASPRPPVGLIQWLSIAEQARDAGMLYLLLTGGEPFLWQDFWPLYERLSTMGFLISINSNGTLLDEARVARLAEHPPTRINITLYGAGNETYEALCGRSGMFDRVDRAITLLRQAGILVKLNCSLTPHNAGDLEGIVSYAAERDLILEVNTYMFPPLRRDPTMVGRNDRFTPAETAHYHMERYRLQRGEEDFTRFLQNILRGIAPPPRSGRGLRRPRRRHDLLPRGQRLVLGDVGRLADTLRHDAEAAHRAEGQALPRGLERADARQRGPTSLRHLHRLPKPAHLPLLRRHGHGRDGKRLRHSEISVRNGLGHAHGGRAAAGRATKTNNIAFRPRQGHLPGANFVVWTRNIWRLTIAACNSLFTTNNWPKAREPLNKSAAALNGSFAPTYRFENLEIHKVFLQFPNLNLEQNPSLTALAI